MPTGGHFKINLTRKFIIRERNCKSWLWKQKRFLVKPHTLTNFEIQEYYQNDPKFNCVYSGNNLPKNKEWGLCDTS